MTALYFVLLLAAFVSFVLATFDVQVRPRYINFVGWGLALVTLVLVIQQGRLL